MPHKMMEWEPLLHIHRNFVIYKPGILSLPECEKSAQKLTHVNWIQIQMSDICKMLQGKDKTIHNHSMLIMSPCT